MAKKNSAESGFPGTGKNSGAELLARCAACNSNFDQAELTILEEKDQKTTFHAICGKCGTSSLIFLSVTAGGVSGMGVATDLGREEAVEMFGQEGITADEVMDMYECVSKYGGNVTGLVKEF